MTVVNIILVFAVGVLAWKLWRLRRELSKARILLFDTRSRLEERTQATGAGQARLEAILSNMVEGVLVVDKNGGIVLMNPSLRKTFLVDTVPEGRKPLEVIRNIALQDLVDRMLKDAEFNLISEELVLSGAQEKSLQVNAVPIIREDRIEGAILVFHDITELKRLEKVRQDFVANVSHELRTPLSSIKGYAETLMEGALSDTENARDFVNIIYRDSERLSKLIDDLLDLSRIESSKMKMVFLPVELPAVVKKTLAILDNQAKAKAIAIQADIPADLPEVLADETRLSQVLLNLLDNAVKYTPEGGKVRICASRAGQFVQVEVADTGMGIPEKDLPRIFERFYRVDKARSRELGGTGLGLSIVKHIVGAHNGTVWVNSTLGAGSTFSFTIPLAE